tara:strand:+ start:343 stop:504 length:162 start_codon:yes stop_codon:yes gene_type:complete
MGNICFNFWCIEEKEIEFHIKEKSKFDGGDEILIRNYYYNEEDLYDKYNDIIL